MSIYYMENINCSSHAGFKAFRGILFWGLGFRVGGFPGAPIRGSLVFGGYCGPPIMETTTCWSGVGAQVKRSSEAPKKLQHRSKQPCSLF